MNLHRLQQAIYRHRLVSWATMDLTFCPQFMYEQFFERWELR